MCPKNSSFIQQASFLRYRRSSALVITLAALVLISALILVFLNVSLLNRQISFSSAGQFRADIVAHTAMDTIVGDLRNEIVAGSTNANGTFLPQGSSTSNLYIPTTNLTMVPSRVEDQGFTNLVAQSASLSNFWTGSYYSSTITSPVRSASGNSTTNASANGRYILISRWNAPGLLEDPGSGATNNVPGNYIPPDWVLVTRGGAITNATASALPTLATLSDKNATNSNYVVGRYAYAIYNEGALIDVNVAGYPNGSSASGISSTNSYTMQRGLLSQIDLAALLTNPPINDPNGLSDANALVSWRNTATASNAAVYTNYMLNATNGYTSVAQSGLPYTVTSSGTTTTTNVPSPGDQAFVGRRDLISYIQTAITNGASTTLTAALPYLTTFTLTSDQPSYYPAVTPAVNTTAITVNPTNNPDVMAIRVQPETPEFTRSSDGTTAIAGEPLLKHRFPLSRLAWFSNTNGTTGGIPNLELILTNFCMQPGTAGRGDLGCWDYVNPDTGAVMTTLPTIDSLATVASENREPTFWELLQAGILNGSLGASMGGPNTSGVLGGTNQSPQNPTYVSPLIITSSQDISTTRQIFALGLSIMSQYNASNTNTPMVLYLGGEGIPHGSPFVTVPSTSQSSSNYNNLFIAGEVNAPYISWIAQQTFSDDLTAPVPYFGTTNSLVDAYFLFALWNPYRNAYAPPAGQPQQYRIRANGKSYMYFQENAPVSTGAQQDISTPIINTNTYLTFQTTSSRYFNYIDGLRPTDVPSGTNLPAYAEFPSPAVPAGYGYTPYSGSPYQVGICLGIISVSQAAATNMGFVTNSSGSGVGNGSWVNMPVPMTLDMEMYVNGNWVPYAALPGMQVTNYYPSPGFGTMDNDGGGWNQVTTCMNTLNDWNDANYSGAFAVEGVEHSDPRTSRLGYVTGGPESGMLGNNVNNWNLEASGGATTAQGFSFATNFSGDTAYIANFAYNLTNFTSGANINSYADPDGITRKADPNPSGTEMSSPETHGTDSPFYLVATGSARPFFLGRPFASVAEMGYAYRDDPWRTLDFSSTNSADGGLLDLFSAHENDNTNRAGVLDLNGASEPVLAAILMNNYQDPASPTTTPLTASQASTIAQAIRTVIGPFDAPTNVINNIAAMPAFTSQVATATSSSLPIPGSPWQFKFNREAFVRSLADITNTRTWNLLIDVIAQSGRYSPTATSLNNFTVEGERRYWVHVAIDRFTGEVLTARIEPVTE